MTSPTADSLLMGGGVTSASFKIIGAMVSGTITEVGDPQQATDFTTQKPKTWDDGQPIMQFRVTLQTQERADAEDDGKRALYVQAGSNMRVAVRDAVRAAGANGLRPGGYLTVQYVGDGVPSRAGLNPPKNYSASYQPPAAGMLMADKTPAAQLPQAPTQAPVQQQMFQAPVAPAAAPLVTALNPQQPAAPAAPAAGLDATQIAALLAGGVTPEALAGLMGMAAPAQV